MTLAIVFAVFGVLGIVALLWCLRGFSRELKLGRKTVGMVVRVETTIAKAAKRNHAASNTAGVIEITRRAALHSGRLA